MNQLMRNGGDCRTAPATPGLLKRVRVHTDLVQEKVAAALTSQQQPSQKVSSCLEKSATAWKSKQLLGQNVASAWPLSAKVASPQLVPGLEGGGESGLV